MEGIGLPKEVKLLIRDEKPKKGQLTGQEKEILRAEFGLNEFDEETRMNKFKELFPYFNTASFLLSVDGLMELFNLPENYDRTISFEEIVNKVDRVTRQLPMYMDSKKEAESGLEGYQFERIYGDVTTVAPWVAAVIDRNRNFAPLKEEEDLQKGSTVKAIASSIWSTMEGIDQDAYDQMKELEKQLGVNVMDMMVWETGQRK